MPDPASFDRSLIYVNGINGTTGDYLVPPASPAKLAQQLAGRPEDEPKVKPGDLALMRFAITRKYDPAKPESVGWGIIFSSDETDAVREALQPLIEHRKITCGGDNKVFVCEYEAGTTFGTWLNKQGPPPFQVHPEILPYYLLIIGSPETITYDFQYDLGVSYAVGRLCFETADGYAAYVKSVIDYENAEANKLETRKSVAFWGTQHPDDGATLISSQYLVDPLSNGYVLNGTNQLPIATTAGFKSLPWTPQQSTKQFLARLLHDPAAGRPAFLFTASHGLGWPIEYPTQHQKQGALLCQDWPKGQPASAHYFSAADVMDDAHLSGLICFHFACYSVGTPLRNEYSHQFAGIPLELAPAPFVAALPQRMLSHPKGGALAVIGHIEEARGCSIPYTAASAFPMNFENAIVQILNGVPVGHAMTDFRAHYAEQATTLFNLLNQRHQGKKISDVDILMAWIAGIDARNYGIVGDPAVRLRASDLSQP